MSNGIGKREVRVVRVLQSRFLALALGLLAASVFTSEGKAGSTTIAGQKVSCYAAKSIVKSNNVPGPGYAGPGVIYLGPQYLKAYPAVVQRFIFLHECGHQYVGTDETAADCWAAKVGKKQGWFGASQVNAVCKAFWNTQGGQYHLPGPERCQVLKQCFAGAAGRTYAAKSGAKVSAVKETARKKKSKKRRKS